MSLSTADQTPEERLFGTLSSAHRASAIRDTVDAAFAGELDLLDEDSSTLVLASRSRTCTTEDGECGEWTTELPATTSANVDGETFDAVDWELVFERASARSLGRTLGRHVELTDGEEQVGDEVEVHREILVRSTQKESTVEDSREASYQAANERSWARAEQRLASLKEQGTEELTVVVMFDSKIRAATRHSVNWFDAQRSDEIGVELKAESARRQADVGDEAHQAFQSLELCSWEAKLDVVDGAIAKCTPQEFDALLDERPSFIEGVYVDEEDEPSGGGTFRMEDNSRLENYLDVTPSDARTGSEPSPSGEGRVVAGYADPEGFYEIHEHPAFDLCVPFIGCHFTTRVITKKVCGPWACADDWNQAIPDSHGSEVIGAFQSILDGQDSNFTSSSAQELRSYAAYDAWLRLYDVGSAGQYAMALEDASELTDEGYTRTDVFGYSAAGGDCEDPRGSSSIVTAYTDLAYDHGMFIVVHAHNYVDRWDSECSTNGRAAPGRNRLRASRTIFPYLGSWTNAGNTAQLRRPGGRNSHRLLGMAYGDTDRRGYQ